MQYTPLDAFANPVRLKLLCCLSKGRKNVQELIQTCDLAQSAVSQHLTKLKKAGLVTTEKDGKFIYYSLTHKKSAKLAQALQTFLKEVNA